MLGLGVGSALRAAASVASSAVGGGFVLDKLKIFMPYLIPSKVKFVGTGNVSFADGSSEYVNVDGIVDDITAYPFTLAGWVKPTVDKHGHVINLTDISADDVYFSLFHADDEKLYFSARNPTNKNAASSAVTSGVWYHIVGVATSATDRKLYVDGVLTATNTDSVSFPSGLDRASIGSIQRVTPGYSTANIAQVGVWARALSESEIQNIMYKTYGDLKGTELTNLVSWYALDSNTDTYNDAHTTATVNNGTAVNTPTLQDGIYGDYSPRIPRALDNSPIVRGELIGSGSALFVKDVGDYIDCSTSSDFNFSTAAGASNDKTFSISAWIYKKEVDATSLIVGKSNATNTDFLFYTDTNNNLGFTLYTDTYTVNVTGAGNTVLAIDRWYHVASTYDGSGAISGAKLYVDGVLQTISAGSSGTYTGMNHESTTILVIGNWLDLSTREFVGNIAQVGIFSAVLTQEQIQNISQKTYADLITSEKTDLISWWGLDSLYGGEVEGAVVKDEHAELGPELIPSITTLSNWNNTDSSNVTLSIDNGELKADGTSSSGASNGVQINLASMITLDTSSKYLIQIETGEASHTDTTLFLFRAGDDPTGSGVYSYMNNYMRKNETYAIEFTSQAVDSDFYFQFLMNSVDDAYIKIKSISLKKIVSGNMGTLN